MVLRLTRTQTAIVIVTTLALVGAVSWFAGARWSARGRTTASSSSRQASNDTRSDLIRYVEPQNWLQRGPLGIVVLPREPEPEFVGAEACAECHRDRHEDFLHTNHYNTSRKASRKSIKGSFDSGHNKLLTQSGNLHYEMWELSDGFYQTVFVDGEEVHRERIDIVMGSGKMAQTYLYWKDDALFELPVSYFSAMDSWVDSPGYPNGIALFGRAVQMRCLECHSTHFSGKYESPVNYRYDKEHYLLGVTCERCHGPGRRHLEFHRRNPDLEEGKYILNPARLPRDRLNDICAQCHSTGNTPKKPPFTFRPGEPLADYFETASETSDAKPGIHTNNQLQRLSMSRCYQQSDEMSCATCHDTHKKESGDHALFSRRCQKCHQPEDCAVADMGAKIGENCVECHMTKHPVVGGILRSSDKSAPLTMWDHYIKAKIDDAQDMLHKFQSGDGP